jgi:hypothetical protein
LSEPGILTEGELRSSKGAEGNYFFRALEVVLLLLAEPFFLAPPDDLTLLPFRPSLRSFPRSINCSYAPLTTFRATFNELASSRSLGRNVPAASEPASIRSLSCSLICLVIDSGRFRLTRTFSFVATFVTPIKLLCSGGMALVYAASNLMSTTCSSRRKRLDHREVVVIES